VLEHKVGLLVLVLRSVCLVTKYFYNFALTLDLRFYTVNHKKRDILFLTITLANLDRFLQFLYHFNREEILHATVVKFTTSP